MDKKKYNRRTFLKTTGKWAGLLGAGALIAPVLSCEDGLYKLYTIDKDKCTLCDRCLSVCNYKAISYQSETVEGGEDEYFLVIDKNQCTKCGKCEDACNDDAIILL